MTQPGPELRMRLTELVSQRPSPTRRQVLRRSVLATGLGAIWWGGGLALLGTELGERPWGWLLVTLAVWTASGALGGYFALSSGGSALGRSRPLLARLVAAILFVLLAVSVAAGWLWPETQLGPQLPWAAHGGCFTFTLVLAAGPLAGLLWSRQGSDPVRPATTGMLLGAVAGAWGGIGMSLHCVQTGSTHLLLGHVLPVVAAVVVGATLGGVVLRLGSKRPLQSGGR